MSSTMDLIRGAAASVRGGNADAINQLQSEGETSSGSDVSVVEPEDVVVAGDQTQESDMDLFSDGSNNVEDAQADSSKTPEAAAAANKDNATSKTPSKEVITITDDKGKRQVEIDFSDKEALKKHIQMAYGARKWQAERDQARTEHKAVQTKLAEVEGNWKALEDAYQNGVEGLVDLLEGRKGAFQEWEKQRIARHEFLRRASPEEIAALKEREEAQLSRKEVERLRKENEDFKKSVQTEREQAELHALESRVNPAFNKYSFSGKLGNADDESMFDEMLWNTAMKRLEPYETKGLPITPELVDREFRAVATSLNKRISGQADKKAAQSIEKTKQAATENVQSAVVNGYRGSSLAQEANEMMNNGNLKGLLSNWGKYKSAFTRK